MACSLMCWPLTVHLNPPSFCLLQLSSLKELAERLKKQLSREKSGRVQTKLKALLKRRDRIKELSVKRREELELSRMLCIFNRDVAEVTNNSDSNDDIVHF